MSAREVQSNESTLAGYEGQRYRRGEVDAGRS